MRETSQVSQRQPGRVSDKKIKRNRKKRNRKKHKNLHTNSSEMKDMPKRA